MVASPRASANQRNTPPPTDWGDERQWIRLVAEAARLLFDGRVNTTGSITLTASSTTSTLTDPRIGPASVILLMPTTANARDAAYYITPGTGSAVITHASNSQTDRTFGYVIFG